MSMSEADFRRLAGTFCSALHTLDRTNPWQILGWYTSVASVQFELSNTFPRFDKERFEEAAGVPTAAGYFAHTWLGRESKLKSAHSCRRCRRHLEGEWSRAEPGHARNELNRQMNAGRCDPCTLVDAAVEVADAEAAGPAERRARQLRRAWKWADEQDLGPGVFVTLTREKLAELLIRET
jgi:hypothetical protein